MYFRRRPSTSPWYFISMFFVAMVTMYFLSNAIPFFNWNFLGIIFPLVGSVLAGVSSGIYGKWDEGKLLVLVCLGFAAGGAFALYIMPAVIR